MSETFIELCQRLNVPEALQKAVAELGYETPSPIQEASLPILLTETSDFLGLAATGTGKTAAFSIPLLVKTDRSLHKTQSIILTPTRELAIQVSSQINALGKHMGIQSASVYGGTGYGDQIRALRRGVPIVVGTPGRIVDHIERGALDLSSVRQIVLDEADEMISMGFKEDLSKVLEGTKQRTIWLFSATMSPQVRKVADTYLRTPKQAHMNKTQMLPDAVEQYYYVVPDTQKVDVLRMILELEAGFYGLIFCQTKVLVQSVTEALRDARFKVDCIHGDMDQSAREKTLLAFRAKRVSILVCTDVASRGLDVKDVTHVVNFSIPRELDAYVHRIGRTARCGTSGCAISLVSPASLYLVKRLAQMTKRPLIERSMPSTKDVARAKVAQVRAAYDEITDSAVLKRIKDCAQDVWADVDKELIVPRLLMLLVPDLDRLLTESVRPVKHAKTFPAGIKPNFPIRSKRPAPGGRRQYETSFRH